MQWTTTVDRVCDTHFAKHNRESLSAVSTSILTAVRNREISVIAAWDFRSVTTFLYVSWNFETVLTEVSLQKMALNIMN
jgi:hypothetical protein